MHTKIRIIMKPDSRRETRGICDRILDHIAVDVFRDLTQRIFNCFKQTK